MRPALLAATLMLASPAWAEQYTGFIDRVDSKASLLRFQLNEPNLSLYASGLHQDLLLRAFFAKMRVTVDYQGLPCGGGVTGKCGTVNVVSVEQKGL